MRSGAVFSETVVRPPSAWSNSARAPPARIGRRGESSAGTPLRADAFAGFRRGADSFTVDNTLRPRCQKPTIEYQTPQQFYNRGKQLEGMTFRDVLELGIVPEGVTREYNSRRYKGGMGTLIEERFFGYKANSDREADFAEAGVELKATCIDRRKNGKDAAGERLVLTMIPYDKEAPASLYDSHLWHKCQRMLLVWYRRDKTIDPYDQRIDSLRYSSTIAEGPSHHSFVLSSNNISAVFDARNSAAASLAETHFVCASSSMAMDATQFIAAPIVPSFTSIRPRSP